MKLATDTPPTVWINSSCEATLASIVDRLSEESLTVRASSAEPESFAADSSCEADDVVVLAWGPFQPRQAGDLSRLLERLRNARVVVVAPDPQGAACRRALRSGANAVVDESSIDSALTIAVRGVQAGQCSVPLKARDQLGAEALSAREKQVLSMVVIGCTNAEIASRLFLAESTVKSHLSSAFTKLGVGSRTEAASLILDPREGLGVGILGIPATSAA